MPARCISLKRTSWLQFMYTHQLQSALAKYRFASSRCSAAAQPSLTVAFPPFTTVPFNLFRSASGPVFVAFVLPKSCCPGIAPSETPSWPAGTRSNVDWFDARVGNEPEVTLAGSARSASSTMYWCGGHAFGASLAYHRGQPLAAKVV